MRGARITVACDCGDVGYVAYGERWVCPKCGRTWNTAQIPADEYWGIMRDMRRMRITVIGVALAIVVPIAALVPFLGIPILLAAPAGDGLLVHVLHAPVAPPGARAGQEPAQVETQPRMS